MISRLASFASVYGILLVRRVRRTKTKRWTPFKTERGVAGNCASIAQSRAIFFGRFLPCVVVFQCSFDGEVATSTDHINGSLNICASLYALPCLYNSRNKRWNRAYPANVSLLFTVQPLPELVLQMRESSSG